MNATISTGATAHHAPLARTPVATRSPIASPHIPASGKVTFSQTKHGYLARQYSSVVGWIVCGYHLSKSKNPTITHESRFVDVAYYRKTRHGVNLETVEFATLAQAREFLTNTFRAKATTSKGGAA